MTQRESAHESTLADSSLTGASSTLTLVSLAHGINHAQAALKPLVFPKAAFGAMAAAFVLASLGVVLGRLREIAVEHGQGAPVHGHH